MCSLSYTRTDYSIWEGAVPPVSKDAHTESSAKSAKTSNRVYIEIQVQMCFCKIACHWWSKCIKCRLFMPATWPSVFRTSDSWHTLFSELKPVLLWCLEAVMGWMRVSKRKLTAHKPEADEAWLCSAGWNVISTLVLRGLYTPWRIKYIA